MSNLILAGKLIGLLILTAGAGYYLYTGVKVFRMERIDFEPTPYTGSKHAEAALDRMLQVAEPAEWELPGSGRQSAFYRPSTSGAMVILLHGSPGSGAGMHYMVKGLADRGVGSLVIDLPGYGASEGQRSWQTHYDHSVMRGIDFLEQQPEVDGTRISLLGYSQGACIASRVTATDDRVSRLMIMAGYTNLYDQLNHQFRWRLPGIGLFAVAAAKAAGVDFELMDSVAALSQVRHKPVLVISGAKDQIIPIEMAETLAATSNHGALWRVEGAGHIDLPEVAGPALYERIAHFANIEADQGVLNSGRSSGSDEFNH